MADDTHATPRSEARPEARSEGAAPAAPQSSDSSGSASPRSSSDRPGSGGSGPGGSGPGGPRPPRPAGGGGRKFFRRKKVCKFCVEKIEAIPYRDVRLLQQFVAERGKITPRRLTGVCTTHQRRLTRAIKQARNIALLPFAARY